MQTSNAKPIAKHIFKHAFPLITSVFLVAVDSTFINIVIIQLAKDLNTHLNIIQVLISLYLLVMGSFLLVGGRLADTWGSKKTFRIGTALFALGSIISALATQAWHLLLGWSVIEGIGAALLIPASNAYVLDNFKGKNRVYLYGLLGAATSAGAALGPMIGGFIATHWTWRYSFMLQAVIAGVILVTSKSLKKDSTITKTPINIIDALLAISGIALLVYGIIRIHDYGLFRTVVVLDIISILPTIALPKTFLFVLSGALLLTVFWIKQRNSSTPFIDPKLFENRLFLQRMLVGLAVSVTQGGYLFILPIFLQLVKGASPLTTTFYLLPLGGIVLVTSLISARLPTPDWKLLLLGLSSITAGAVYAFAALSPRIGLIQILTLSALVGAGIGLITSRLANYILSVVDTHRSGQAAGIYGVLWNIGNSLGTAIMGTLFFSLMESGINSPKAMVVYATRHTILYSIAVLITAMFIVYFNYLAQRDIHNTSTRL